MNAITTLWMNDRLALFTQIVLHHGIMRFTNKTPTRPFCPPAQSVLSVHVMHTYNSSKMWIEHSGLSLYIGTDNWIVILYCVTRWEIINAKLITKVYDTHFKLLIWNICYYWKTCQVEAWKNYWTKWMVPEYLLVI